MISLASLVILVLLCAQEALSQGGMVLEYLFEDTPGRVVMDTGGYGYNAKLERTKDVDCRPKLTHLRG